MPVSMTVQDLKTRLSMSCAVTSLDGKLEKSLEGIEAAWLRATGRKLFFSGATEKTIYLDGPGRDVLILPRPVVEISAVFEDYQGFGGQKLGSFAAETELDQGDSWFVDNLEVDEDNPGKLWRIDSFWNGGRGSVKVVGKFGYTAATCPADVLEAIAAAVSLEVKGSAKGGPIKSETIGSYSYELLTGADGFGFAGSDKDALSSIRATVARYKEFAVG